MNSFAVFLFFFSFFSHSLATIGHFNINLCLTLNWSSSTLSKFKMRLVATATARLLTCLAGAEIVCVCVCIYIDRTQVQSRRKQWRIYRARWGNFVHVFLSCFLRAKQVLSPASWRARAPFFSRHTYAFEYVHAADFWWVNCLCDRTALQSYCVDDLCCCCCDGERASLSSNTIKT